MIGPHANTKQITAALDITQSTACDESAAGGTWVTISAGDGVGQEEVKHVVGFVYRGTQHSDNVGQRGYRIALINREGEVVVDGWHRSVL